MSIGDEKMITGLCKQREGGCVVYVRVGMTWDAKVALAAVHGCAMGHGDGWTGRREKGQAGGKDETNVGRTLGREGLGETNQGSRVASVQRHEFARASQLVGPAGAER